MVTTPTRCRVILAEDEAGESAIIVDTLEQLGCTVVTARSGGSIAEQLRRPENAIDAVVVDGTRRPWIATAVVTALGQYGDGIPPIVIVRNAEPPPRELSDLRSVRVVDAPLEAEALRDALSTVIAADRSTALDRGESALGKPIADVRQMIVEASRQLCEEAGAPCFTIRAIAARVGVSTTILYRSFHAKSDIEEALRRDGIDRLDAHLRDAIVREPAGVGRFLVSCERYVEFAFEHPRLYDLLFAGGSVAAMGPGEPRTPGLLRTIALSLDTERESRNEVRRIDEATQVLAALHGLVCIMRRMGLTADVGRDFVHEYIDMLSHAYLRSRAITTSGRREIAPELATSPDDPA